MATRAALLIGFALCTVAACARGGAHQPLSPEAARVQYTTEQDPARSCKLLGTARGHGTDESEKVAERRALDAAREQAAKLGGNLIVLLEQQRGAAGASAGVEAEVVDVVDVYRCEDAGGATR
jgi:hypothetical protein